MCTCSRPHSRAQVCDALGVELEVVPLTRAYWDSVVAHSVAQIRAVRTPNPDMLCNSRVKFGAFLDLLEARGAMAGAGGTKAVQPGPAQGAGRAADGHSEEGAGSVAETLQVFDRVASGHYARVVRSQQAGCAQLVREQRMRSGAPADTSAAAAAAAGSAGNELTDPLAVISSSSSSSGGGAPNGNKELSATDCGSNDSSGGSSSSNGSGAHLALSADPVKDQSYFLAQLSPRQLSRVMFPLGGLTKRQVRPGPSAAVLCVVQWGGGGATGACSAVVLCKCVARCGRALVAGCGAGLQSCAMHSAGQCAYTLSAPAIPLPPATVRLYHA